MEDNKFDDGDHWLLQSLQDLYKTKRHCDVEIRIQNNSFHCHRVILSAASGYFDVMFTSGMREANSSVVEIKDMSSNTFADVLDFVYNAETVITDATVEALLHVACRLQIPRLKDECESFLVEKLSAENCVGFWLTARLLCCGSLQKASWSFILECFDDVIAHDEYLKLETSDILEVIKDDNLKTQSEDNVCRASLRWVKANETTRKPFLTDLISEIRLCQVNLEFLLHEIYSNSLVLSDKNCLKLLTKAVTYHALPDRRHMSNSLSVRLRNTSNKASLFVVIGRRRSIYGSDITEIFGYSAKDGKWYSLCSMACDLGDDFATCAYGNDVFVSGGTAKPDAFLRFSAKQYKWIERPGMIQGRYRHNIVAVSNSIYAVGGYNFGTIESIEEYDISASTWQIAGKLRHAVDAATAVTHAEKIFVFGGWQGFAEETTAIQCFDTDTNECSVVSHLPSPQKDARAISFNNTMYIVCTNGDILSFRPDLTLKKLDVLQDFGKKNFSVHKEGKGLYILGGETTADEFDEDEANFSDEIRSVHVKSSATSEFPTSLPVPVRTLGCFQTVIRLKYPLVEFSEQFSFTH